MKWHETCWADISVTACGFNLCAIISPWVQVGWAPSGRGITDLVQQKALTIVPLGWEVECVSLDRNASLEELHCGACASLGGCEFLSVRTHQ